LTPRQPEFQLIAETLDRRLRISTGVKTIETHHAADAASRYPVAGLVRYAIAPE
jgi:hypothetical protein